jgi:hypothetical protein
VVGAIGTGGTESPCGDDNPPTFSAVVFFEGSSSSAALAPATDTATSAVPVPNAIDQAPADATAQGGAASQQAGEQAPATTEPAAAAGTSTTSSTTTTTGGTE